MEETLVKETDTLVSEEEIPTETEALPDLPTYTDEAAENLADGFLQLQKEIPELKEITDVPEAVLEMAATENVSLLDAYLRYRFQEERAVLRETERQQRVALQAAGSLSGGTRAAPAADAFTRAFEQALR